MLLPGMRGVAALVVTMVAIFILGQLLKRTLGGANRRCAGPALNWRVNILAGSALSQPTYWNPYADFNHFTPRDSFT